ncbi:putative chaperone protein HSP31 [Coleophoma cylindrospora]|uniref:D-lactate dehydratase n=1 Tax=Coleophoma cylindrospora TaxID=1849047 RepID=A0A3D8QU48_9HELO|nr:putative chaperone protein HSP31 [Coleophoma cylindrospora]
MAPKVLVILTSHDKMGNTGKPTGWYLPEFAHPYEALEGHADIVVASPNGGASPLDPSSVEAFKSDESSVSFLNNKKSLWENTAKLSDFLGKAKEFDAIFFVGGHGPMWDLAVDATSHKLISEFADENKVISAVCHGPAALTQVKLSNGKHLLAGEPVTGFSNSEETAVGLVEVMPFSLEDALNEGSGGKYSKAAQDWTSHVVVGRGGKLITGQNPASASDVGKAIKQAIGA